MCCSTPGGSALSSGRMSDGLEIKNDEFDQFDEIDVGFMQLLPEGSESNYDNNN